MAFLAKISHLDLGPALKFIFLHENNKIIDSIGIFLGGKRGLGRKSFGNWTGSFKGMTVDDHEA